MSASHPTSTERHLTCLYTVFEREVVPFGDPTPGVVELYVLTPIDPLFTPVAVWLDEHTQAPW